MRDLRAGLEQPNCSGPHAEEALTKSARCRLTAAAKKCRQSHTHKTLRELHCVGLLCIFTSGELLLFYRLHAKIPIYLMQYYTVGLFICKPMYNQSYRRMGGGGGGALYIPAAHRLVIMLC